MEVKSIAYLSKAAYKGNGSTVQYSAPFPYISQSHVVVTVDNVQKAFTWLNTGTIKLTAAPSSGASVVVKRVTPRSTRLVDFTDGSILTEKELDLSALQLLYILQEILDEVADTIHYDFSSDKYDAGGRPITNVGDPITDADVVTLNYYKTVVLPLLMAEAARVAREAVAPVKVEVTAALEAIRNELTAYRTLIEDYRARLEAATARLEADTSDAIAQIRSMTDAARAKFEAFTADLHALAELITRQAENVRLALVTVREARDEVRALSAEMKEFRFMGDWRNGTVYRPQNVVYHGGSSYVLVSGDGTNEPMPGMPAGEGWQFLAKRGENYYARVIDGGAPDTEFTVYIDGGTPDEF